MPDLSSALTPSVAPDATPPQDSQHIEANPSAFGAAIAQGVEKFGQGAQTAGKFFGQVAADNASNTYQEYATKVLHGDPNKQVPGPDGTMGPDTGYLGLRGQAALDARPQVSKQLDDYLKQTRETLTTPEQQLQFDNFSRRYRAGVEEKVGSHADDQAKTWYQSVNTASAKIALDHISINADNPKEYMAGEADLVHAYVKTAQLNGARPPDPKTGFAGDPQYQEAVANARRDALRARLDQVAVKDPARAVATLDKPENRQIAGQYYDNMSASYRGRAKQQQGYDIADQTIRDTYTNQPVPNPVALTNAGAQYGVSGSYLMRVHQLEGNGVSSTGAQGPFQFTPTTAKQYGLKDPFNYPEAADAAARLTADNRVSLTASLGRPPSDAELYLAHQQGAEGAAKLLANPNARAGNLVGDRAVRVNGGDPNMTAAAFAGMWTQKFNQAPVAAAESRKASAYQKILSIPDSDIDPDVRQHALSHVQQTLSAQQVAEEQDAKAQKATHDKMQGDFTARIIKGDTGGIIGEIANSGLPANEMQNLYKFAVGDGGVSDPLQYGPSYSEALKRVLASPDTPGRIDGPRDIIQMGAEGTLTKRGVDELLKTQKQLQADPESAGETRTKSAQLDYYKSQFSIDQEMTLPGMKPYKSQKGLDKFNHEFVPAFESAYGQWTKAGKSGMDFLKDKKQLDAIMDSVYPPAQRAADAISAEGGGVDDHKAPPPPQGVEPKAWTRLMAQAPYKADGSQWSMKDWGGPTGPVAILRQNPTPQNIALFNQHFGDYAKAEDVLKAMPPKGYVPQAAAPGAPAAQPAAAAPKEAAGYQGPVTADYAYGQGAPASIGAEIGTGATHAAKSAVHAVAPLFVGEGGAAPKGPRAGEVAGAHHKPKETRPADHEKDALGKLVSDNKLTPAEIERNRKRAEADAPGGPRTVGIRG